MLQVCPVREIKIVEPKSDGDTKSSANLTMRQHCYGAYSPRRCSLAASAKIVDLKAGAISFKDGWYWVPIIALYTGMRLAEVVQLATEDVRNEHGIWFYRYSSGRDPQNVERKSN